MSFTKSDLVNKIAELEQELHEANNAVDYWQYESNRFLDELNTLKDKISNDKVFNFLKNCNINQEAQLTEFINTIKP